MALLGALAIVVIASRLGDVSGAGAAGDPVIVAAGDIACDPANKNFNGGNGQNGACMQKATYSLIANMSPAPAAVLPLGDNQYYCAGYQAFLGSYALSWGKLLSKTYPVVGNHEYLTAPGSDGIGTGCDSTNTNAAGYWKYYAGAANEGTSGQGWYSYDVGSWHLIAINSNCGNVGGCGATSAQGKWLAGDLAAHKNQCIAAYWHIPLWSSGGRAAANTQPIVDQLYAAHADVILTGHDHIYERFAQQTNKGALDSQNGIREFIAGTGGANHTSIATIAANSQYRNATDFGILKLTLHSGSYDWAFVNTANTVLDQGSNACHNTGGGGGTPPPAPSVTPSETDATDFVSGSTVYYRQGASGSFSVAAASTGATSITFPSIAGMTGGGPDSSSPFSTTYSWTSSTTASGSFGVTASNSTGTSGATPFTVTPDATAPTTTATCAPSSCSASSGSSVAVTLSSSDAGSGLGQIYYTTDGTTPTTTSSTVANGGSVSVTAGGVVKFFAVDRVGNQETVKSKATTVATGGGGGSSVTLQQQKVATASSAAGVTATLSTTTAGDALVAAIAVAGGSTGPIASVTDSSGGTWTKGPTSFLSGSNTRIELWYRLAAPPVASVTASFASGTTKSVAMNVSEWSGVAGVDTSATGSGTSTTAATPSLATRNANDVVVGAVNFPGTATSTLASGTFTSLSDFNVGSTHGRAAYLTTTGTGSYQASWTLSASSAFGSAILALSGASGSAPAAPTLSLQANDGNDFVSGSTVFYGPAAASGSFTVSATSSGATAVQFPVVFGADGGNDTSSPFSSTYSWLSGASASGSFTVTAGNSFGTSPAASFTVTPDSTAPVSGAPGCNGGSDCSGSYSGTVTVKLTATDTGGSGVKAIYYTTNGSDPTGSSSSIQSGATVQLPVGTTLKYRAGDNVGNLEATRSLTLGSAPPAPSLSLQANDSNDFVSGSTVFYGPAAASGSFTVSATSSGATAVQFPVVFGADGGNDTSSPFSSTYSWASGAGASGSFNVTASNTFGTSTATSFTVTLDATAPASGTPTCNGGSDCSGSYSGTVTVTLTATDTGSGLKAIYYTTDGSDPTRSSSSVRSGGTVQVQAGTAVKYRAGDNVGNLEVTKSVTPAQAAPPAPTLSLQASDATDYANGTTVYYNPTALSGSFTVSATTSGSAVQFPAVFGADSVNDTTTPYSQTYTWATGATASGSFGVTASNGTLTSTPSSFTVTPDGTAPQSGTPACNLDPDCSGSYSGTVTVKLTATDTGGSGVKAIYYTTNGNDPGTSSSSVQPGGTVQVPAGTALKYRAGDNVGNLEVTKTVTPAGQAPPAPTVSLQATDATDYVSGSTVYYNPSALSGGSFTVSATTSGSAVQFPAVFGTDSVNDTTTPYSQTYTWAKDATASGSFGVTASNSFGTSTAANFAVIPDTTAPQSGSPTCNGNPCGGSYSANVTVTLTATDTGSGLKAIYYTLDGTDPSTSSSSVPSGGTVQVAPGTTLEYSAGDNVGNLEGANSLTPAGQAPAAPSLSLQTSDATDYVSGTTVYYNPSALSGGSFTVSATTSGSAVQFPAVFGTDSVNDTTTPYSQTYTWAKDATASGSFGVTASNTFGTSTATSFTVTLDATAPASGAPTCNGGSDCSGSYSGTVTVKLTATDIGGSGVKAIYYTTDGNDPTSSSSSIQSGATVQVPAGTTLKYSAGDNVGNLELANAITPAGQAPPAPTLILQASDATDYVSGTTVYYNPSALSGSFTVSATTSGSAVQFPAVFGTDSVNDTTTPYSQTYTWATGATASGSFGVTASNTYGTSTATSFTVTPDMTAPQSGTPTCNLDPDCSGSYSGTVTVKLTATDTGGSGVNAIYYTTDGNDPGTSSSSVQPGGTVTVPAGGTVKYRAADNVGNLEAVKSVTPAQTSGGGGGTTTLTPIADTYVTSASPTTNNGTKPNIYVDADGVSLSYLKFDLSGVSGPVTSVTLNIFAASSQSTGYRVFNVGDTTWGETTLTWNTKPPFDATSSGSSGKVTSGTWTSVTLPPSLVQSALGGMLSLGLDTTNTQNLKLDAREAGASLAPQLVITTS